MLLRVHRRGFTRLQPVARRRLIDSLVSNLSVLSACVDSALGSDAETLLRHRTALKLYVFFLHWPLAQAEAEARDGGVMVPPAAAAAKCGLSLPLTLIGNPIRLKVQPRHQAQQGTLFTHS